jgi:hypothetical protein
MGEVCTVIVFAPLDELRVLGPVWVREMLKRRTFGAGLGQVVEFERLAHAASLVAGEPR